MEPFVLALELIQGLLLIVISVIVYRQSVDYRRVEELLQKAQEAAQRTETELDDTVISLAGSLLKFLSSLRAVHVEVKSDGNADAEVEEDVAQG